MAEPVQKILLVDDDPEDRAIMKEVIEYCPGKEMYSFAHNGEEALSSLEGSYQSGDLPSLIVLDLNMPRMNGTEVLSVLKSDQRFRDIPVIIYSTSINLLEKEKCMNLGAHSYIAKPVSLSESIETATLFSQYCSEGKSKVKSKN